MRRRSVYARSSSMSTPEGRQAMTRQRTLFDDDDDQAAKRGLPPSDPNVHPADRVRLSGQNAAILARLQRGPASNEELAGISLKYTSRISDLRAAGYNVTCTRGVCGVHWYWIE